MVPDCRHIEASGEKCVPALAGFRIDASTLVFAKCCIYRT